MKTYEVTREWKRVAAGNYKLGCEWQIFERVRGDWIILRYGEELKGCGSCTLKTAKRKVETLINR